MKKTILTILGVILIGGGLYVYSSKNSADSSDTEKTINLMGIEMTEQQAFEHCQMMPAMDGCALYLNN